MAKFFPATELLGGAQGALDAIDGDLLGDGDGAIVITPGGSVHHYTLSASSAALPAPPDIISPVDNAGDKRWLLCSSLPVSTHLSKFDKWVEVNNSAALEAALAAGEQSIYLLAGPDYILNKPIVPYDGLTLRSERLPTSLDNAGNDGVKITIPAGQTFAPISYDKTAAGYATISGLTMASLTAGDLSVNITSGLNQTINAGSIVSIDNMAYRVMSDAVPVTGVATINLSHPVWRDSGGFGSLDVYATPLRNFTIQGINIADLDESGSKIYAAVNMRILDCAAQSGNWLFAGIYSSVGLRIIGGGYCSVRAYYSAGIRVLDLQSDGAGDGYIGLSLCSYITLNNCRGVLFNMMYSRYYDIRNCHAGGSVSLYDGAYYTVDSCSADSFNCGAGDNFTVMNCAARVAGGEVTLTGATNYQVYGNRWQAAV